MHLPDPTFPPLLCGHGVKSPQTPLAEAIAGIAAGRLGAGDIVWSRSTERFALAVIFEPEVRRDRAAEMLPLAIVALGDALGALVPPELPITWLWPGTVRADGAKVGEARMAMGPDDEAGIPHFVIIDIWIALRVRGGDEPGQDLDNTTLYDEGCGDLDRTSMIESFSRHLMTWLHRWSSEGFASVHEAFLFRADQHRETVTISHGGQNVSGTFTGLDESGNLLLRNAAGVVRLSLLDSTAMIRPQQQ